MVAISDKVQKQQYRQARLARDARFDGLFFTGVKTTGIYCRPICSAKPPLEKNVEYYKSAVSAAEAGLRPCLRCRPDSAPQSCAWLGNSITFERALTLIQQGALQEHSLHHLAHRLGISDRYLRALFHDHLGTSPKRYALYEQCLFAKKLLHETDMAITNVAFAAGFNSVRRFNEVVKQQLDLNPRDIRKSRTPTSLNGILLKLYYRPPYARQQLFQFLQRRAIHGLEWVEHDSDGDSGVKPSVYARTFSYQASAGYFSVTAVPNEHRFDLRVHLENTENVSQVVRHIAFLFDVDAPITQIDQTLQTQVGSMINYQPGLRLPGIWNSFEAGVRAILGQQISVGAAKNLVTSFVENLGKEVHFTGTPARFLFPEPADVIDHPLDFFRMPQARKDTLRRLAEYMLSTNESTTLNAGDIDAWLKIKGIGPWTVNYVKMRAAKDPDIWLVGDAGLKNALKGLDNPPDTESVRPWRSYLTMQMWNQL